MKHKNTLLLALGMAAVGAVAQNVVVVLNDGTSQKFAVDDVKELKFVEMEETPPVEFTTIDINPWSASGITVTFKDATGNVEMVTDMYGPSGEAWMHAGTYACDASGSAYTFDPDYTTVTLGTESFDVTGGTIEVSLEGEVYTFEMNLTLKNGEDFRATWSGELPTYTQWVKAELTSASYNTNPQLPGTFYVKFNDAPDYNYEMAIIFNGDVSATELPAATYAYSDATTLNSISPASYVSINRPYAEVRLTAGSEIQVVKEGEEYVITMELNLSDGRIGKFNFRGKISGEPVFETPEPDGVKLTEVDETVYGSGNVSITLKNDEYTVELDMYGSSDAKYMEPGTYVVGADSGFYIGNDQWSSFSQTVDGVTTTKSLKSGTVTVSEKDGEYTFLIDITLEDDTTFKGWYIGALSAYGSVITRDMTKAEYNDTPRNPGNIYVKFQNDNWDAVALDFYVDAEATTLPAGTYTYGDRSTEAGTFGWNSYAELNLGYGDASNRLAAGSEVTVEKEDQNYTVTMHLILESGRVLNATYTGEIDGTPVFN